MSALERVSRLLDAGDQAAAPLVFEGLSQHPDDPRWLFEFGRAMLIAEKPAVARLALERVVELEPQRFEAWLNLGYACEPLSFDNAALNAFQRALILSDRDPLALVGLSTSALNRYDLVAAVQFAEEALAKAPGMWQARINRGHANLLRRHFDTAWSDYAEGVGRTKSRDEHAYGSEVRWAGERDARVVIYGEQGVGDQITYMAAASRAARDARVVAINCYPKLRGLFQRTFPQIPVFGDQFKKDCAWAPGAGITHRCAMSHLMALYRHRHDDYGDGVYLCACPRRRAAARALLDNLGAGLKIGLAWSGGLPSSVASAAKTVPLSTFEPLIDAGHHIVSLEYREPDEATRQSMEAYRIHDFPWLTRTEDYDDTAALVAELDAIVCVPTAAYHLAGALGVPAYVLTHNRPHFWEGAPASGERVPWYESVRMVRRGDDTEAAVRRIVVLMEELHADLHRRRCAAARGVHGAPVEHHQAGKQAREHHAALARAAADAAAGAH